MISRSSKPISPVHKQRFAPDAGHSATPNIEIAHRAAERVCVPSTLNGSSIHPIVPLVATHVDESGDSNSHFDSPIHRCSLISIEPPISSTGVHSPNISPGVGLAHVAATIHGSHTAVLALHTSRRVAHGSPTDVPLFAADDLGCPRCVHTGVRVADDNLGCPRCVHTRVRVADASPGSPHVVYGGSPPRRRFAGVPTSRQHPSIHHQHAPSPPAQASKRRGEGPERSGGPSASGEGNVYASSNVCCPRPVRLPTLLSRIYTWQPAHLLKQTIQPQHHHPISRLGASRQHHSRKQKRKTTALTRRASALARKCRCRRR